MNPTVILGILLALSVLGNGYQYHEHDKLVATAATAETVGRGVQAAADACSTSVANLATQGLNQRKETLDAIAKLGPQIEGYKRASTLALLAKPDNPADLCGSLLGYLQREVHKEHAP